MEYLRYLSILLWAIIELSIVKGYRENGFGVNFYSLEETTFDVTKFGAKGDGKTDDSKAFESTWAAACQTAGESVKMRVPYGKAFLLSPIEFGGPCKPHKITFEIFGSIIAQPKLAWKNKTKGGWLKFHGVNGLSVVGNDQGSIDGQGHSWWQDEAENRPDAMLFSNCNNLQIMGLKHLNSQKFHLSLSSCNNTIISKLHIIAPQTSPNTDGIDIATSRNITIQNCIIETGDDCIAIKGGISNVKISQITCGPGHGISIGSLGQSGKYDEVEGININNCTMRATQNGVRIKTWQGGSGFARNINFTNIIFAMADNPVIIDQFYCPHKICANQTSAVKVSGVRFSGLRGTAESKTPAISFRCSNTVPCTNIIVEGLDITSSDRNKALATVCLNAHGFAKNVTTPPLNCLQK